VKNIRIIVTWSADVECDTNVTSVMLYFYIQEDREVTMMKILPKLMSVREWNMGDKTIVVTVLIMSIVNFSLVILTK